MVWNLLLWFGFVYYSVWLLVGCYLVVCCLYAAC